MTAAWPMVPLGDVLKPANDRTEVETDKDYPNFGIYCFGRGLFHKPPIVGVATSAKTLYRAQTGQFVYSRLFAFEGAYGLVTPEYDGHYLSNEFPLFDCRTERLLPEFLAAYFRLERAWREVAQSSTGVGHRRQRVQPEQLLTYRLPLPPLPEQRRIVAKLDQFAASIHEARGLRRMTEVEAEALPRTARRTAIGSAPHDSWATLATCVKDIENGWSPACLPHPALVGEWAVIKVGAVSFGKFDPNQNKALPPTLTPTPQYEIRSGDFLMSRANTRELVGACTYVENAPPRLILCDKVFRFIFHHDGRIEPRYLDHTLKSPALREQIERAASGTSPTMKNISKAKILALRLPLPPPAKQRQIVDELDEVQAQVDRLKKLQAQTAAELDALLPSIVDKAFKGEL